MSDWLPAFGTAQENFAQAQKWRGITHFGGVPGGQEPNFTKALHYYDACLRIEPAHEFAMSHRAICLWSLGRRAEAVRVLNTGLTNNLFQNHADTGDHCRGLNVFARWEVIDPGSSRDEPGSIGSGSRCSAVAPREGATIAG